MKSRTVIFSGHFWAFLSESMRAGRVALTALAFRASAMARAAAMAAFLTAVILSPAPARTLGRRATRYGSTEAETSEC
jgi:hypothetical protein